MTNVTEKNYSHVVLETLDYVYDMYDELISRTDTPYSSGSPLKPTKQHFVFDPQNNGEMVLGFDGTGKIADRYVYGPVVDQILADKNYSTPSAAPSTAGTTLWTILDNQNSVHDVVKYDTGTSSVVSVEHVAYNSFGAKLSDTGTVTFAVGYDGSYTEITTGLQWHRARWYDPAVQRWMSEDPAGLTYGSNPDIYANNDATNVVDPTGFGGHHWVPQAVARLYGCLFDDDVAKIFQSDTSGKLAYSHAYDT